MKLTHITGINVKVPQFSHELSGDITIFCGPNGAGKSARLGVLPLALFGYLPGLKRTNPDVFALSRGSSMTAAARFSDGSGAERRWVETKSSIKCEVVREAAAEIIPLCVDVREYFNLSPREQVKLAFRASGCRSDFGMMIVARAKAIKLEEHDAEAEVVVSAICGEIAGLWQKNISGSAPQITYAVPPPEWLDTFAETAKQKCSAAQAAAKKMSATLEGLTELRQRSQTLVNSAAERELADLNQRIAAVAADHREATLAESSAEARWARRVELEAALAGGGGVLLGDARASVEALQAEVDNYVSKRPDVVAALTVLNGEHAVATAEVKRLQALVEHWGASAARMVVARNILDPDGVNERVLRQGRERLSRCRPEVDNYASRTDSLRDQRRLLASQLVSEEAANRWLRQLLSKNDADRDDVQNRSCCPFCDAAESGWGQRVLGRLEAQRKQQLERLAASEETLRGVQEAAAALDRAIVESVARDKLIAKLSADLADEEANVTIAEANRIRAEEMLASVPTESMEQVDGRLKEQVAKLSALEDERTVLLRRLEEANAADAACASARERLRCARERVRNLEEQERGRQRMRAELDGLADALPPEQRSHLGLRVRELAAAHEALQAQIQPLTLQVRQANAQKGEVAAKLKAAEAAMQVAREEQVWRKVKAIVDDIQAEAVRESIGPILAKANLIAAAVLPTPLAYHENRIGRFEGRVFVPCETFSGSEQAVTFAAVCVALAATSGCPLKIAVVDELDRLTPENKRALLKAVRGAIDSGVIAQFCGADVRATDYAGLDGVDVIQL